MYNIIQINNLSFGYQKNNTNYTYNWYKIIQSVRSYLPKIFRKNICVVQQCKDFLKDFFLKNKFLRQFAITRATSLDYFLCKIGIN
jgi:hypothetical protein